MGSRISKEGEQLSRIDWGLQGAIKRYNTKMVACAEARQPASLLQTPPSLTINELPALSLKAASRWSRLSMRPLQLRPPPLPRKTRRT